MSATSVRRKETSTRVLSRKLALATVIAAVLFNLTWLILGFISPGYMLFGEWISPYSAISQPFSGLGLGATGPYMNAAFVLCGLVIAIGAFGIFGGIDGIPTRARVAAISLFALHGVGSVVDGLFTLESFLMHSLGFLLVLCLIPGFLIAGMALRKLPPWSRVGKWLTLASSISLVLTIAYFATFDPVAAGQGQGIAGLTERALVLWMHTWLGILAWNVYRNRINSVID